MFSRFFILAAMLVAAFAAGSAPVRAGEAGGTLSAGVIHSGFRPDTGAFVLLLDRGASGGIEEQHDYVTVYSGRRVGMLTISAALPDSAIGSLEPFTGANVPPAGSQVVLVDPGSEEAGETAASAPDESAAAPPNPLLATGYKVGPDDILKIKSYPPNILPDSTAVRPDGTIVLPLVGTVAVKGLTVYQISDRIRSLMSRDFKRPWVEVSVGEYHSMTVRIFGQVAMPTNGRASGTGEYPLKEKTKILDFITNIGGLDKSADFQNIVVLRKDGTEVRVDFTKIMANPASEDNILLAGGDVIRVPDILGEENKAEVRVIVLGQISRQGVIKLEGGHAGMVDAISQSGGFSPLAALDRVQVLRQEAGSQRTQVVDASKIIAGEAPDFTLLTGDLVYVPQRGEKKKTVDRVNDFLKEILPSANFIYLINRL
jgi:polysaccharide export outer membrane protein